MNTVECLEGVNLCPKCQTGILMTGYGLMGGGMGPYVLCDNDNCDYFEKTQDEEES